MTTAPDSGVAPLASASEPGGTDVFALVRQEVAGLITERVRGRIASVQGLTVTATGLPVPVGARCAIETRRGPVVHAEVVGLRDDRAILSVLGEATGLAPEDPVTCLSSTPRVPVGLDLLGRVIDAHGEPIDDRPAPVLNVRYPLYADPPLPMQRRPIDKPLVLGVRALDGLLTAGCGQRLGIFAGTGVGKSILMGMFCRHTQADVNVIAMVGERGREVRDFLDNDLGPDGLRRSVVVVCTSDEAPALRVRACFHATAIAEFFRDQGCDVLFMMDSLTRMAMAQRQIGLAAGEPPTAKGYPPSTFALLPRLLERAGHTARGSITGIYTVLVEGDDIDEPLADAVRGILDGHVWLSRKLANRGQYPAVDVLNSISRVAEDVVDESQTQAVTLVRRVLATWNDIEDLVSIGAYTPGVDADYDVAVQTREAVNRYLRQDRGVGYSLAETVEALKALGELIEKTAAQVGRTPAAGASAVKGHQ